MYRSSLGWFFITIECRLNFLICKTRINLCHHHAQLNFYRILLCFTVSKSIKEEGKGTLFSQPQGPGRALWRSAPWSAPCTTAEGPPTALTALNGWPVREFFSRCNWNISPFHSVEGIDSISLSGKLWGKGRGEGKHYGNKLKGFQNERYFIFSASPGRSMYKKDPAKK